MSDVKPGALIDATAQRDAIHVALAPVIAGERLVPGSHVGFIAEGETERVGVRSEQLLGVVDPYLRGFVEIGERFWLFLYPNTVTSLRHDWTHPAFPDRSKDYSERWLRNMAVEFEITYEEFLAAIAAGEHCFSNDLPDGFWERREDMCRHFTTVTGMACDPERLYFRCAC